MHLRQLQSPAREVQWKLKIPLKLPTNSKCLMLE